MRMMSFKFGEERLQLEPLTRAQVKSSEKMDTSSKNPVGSDEILGKCSPTGRP